MDWATIITSAGSLLSGLAIIIAFVQLGDQREDQRRAQVNKIGVWTQTGELRSVPDRAEWPITLFIRNASELPVEIPMAELDMETWGYPKGLAIADGGHPRVYADKRIGPSEIVYFSPGTIPPGDTWRAERTYAPFGVSDTAVFPQISIIRLAITDAAGHEWDMRPSQGKRPRRVRWRHEWPWRRPGL